MFQAKSQPAAAIGRSRTTITNLIDCPTQDGWGGSQKSLDRAARSAGMRELCCVPNFGNRAASSHSKSNAVRQALLLILSGSSPAPVVRAMEFPRCMVEQAEARQGSLRDARRPRGVAACKRIMASAQLMLAIQRSEAYFVIAIMSRASTSPETVRTPSRERSPPRIRSSER